MKFNFLVAPDFPPERFTGWHMLNTLLQTQSGLRLRLLTPASSSEQMDLLRGGEVDVVYANPFDASQLVRDFGFRALARPRAKPDEMVIATSAGSPTTRIEELQPGCRIASTDNRDVKLIGLRLLEPADLTENDINWVKVDSYQAGARLAIKQEVDAAFFLAEIYHAFSRTTLEQLRPLIQSAITDITHVLLAHRRIERDMPTLLAALTSIGKQAADQDVLDALGLPQGFEAMDDEDVEFMVDLMDTLLD